MNTEELITKIEALPDYESLHLEDEKRFAGEITYSSVFDTDDLKSLTQRVKDLEAALGEIAKGEGAYSRDPLTFAENCIESMKDIARAALEKKQ